LSSSCFAYRNGFGEARGENDVAAQVASLAAHLGNTAENDVIHERGVNLGARDELAQHRGSQVDRMDLKGTE
jgi:hypothetical protein